MAEPDQLVSLGRFTAGRYRLWSHTSGTITVWGHATAHLTKHPNGVEINVVMTYERCSSVDRWIKRHPIGTWIKLDCWPSTANATWSGMGVLCATTAVFPGQVHGRGPLTYGWDGPYRIMWR